MSLDFAELDYCQTPLGDLILRRRRIHSLGGLEVFEVKLGHSFLMSSLFHEVEVALADLGIAAVHSPAPEVVVGGLGLGYTAVAALRHPNLKSLTVVEALEPVIEWHRRALVPLGPTLAGDPRCRFVLGDFFALANTSGFDADNPCRRFHAILLDIDHSPRNVLNPQNASFYTTNGLRSLAAKLHPGGIFALWSDDPPDADFIATLDTAFVETKSHIVPFHNPLLECDSASTVYVARRG